MIDFYDFRFQYKFKSHEKKIFAFDFFFVVDINWENRMNKFKNEV